MKIKISRSQWDKMGKTAGWTRTAMDFTGIGPEALKNILENLAVKHPELGKEISAQIVEAKLNGATEIPVSKSYKHTDEGWKPESGTGKVDPKLVEMLNKNVRPF